MNKVFVKASASVMAVVVLLMSFVVPVRADNVTPNFVNVPLVLNPGIDDYGVIMISSTIGSDIKQWTLYTYTSNQGNIVEPVYGAIYLDSLNNYCLVCASKRNTDSNGNPVYMRLGMRDIDSYDNVRFNANMLNHGLTNVYDDSYYYTSGSIQVGTSINFTTNVYNSLSEALEGIASGDDGTSQPASLNYSLPAGNAIVIELGQGSNPYEITSSSINPGPFNGNGLGGKQWGFYNSLPSVIEDPLAGASNIDFRGYGSQSVLGQYMLYKVAGDFVLENHTEKYLIIVNPIWAYNSDGMVANTRIDISISKVKSFRVYPLGTQLVDGGWTSQNDGEYLDGNYDENTDTWYTTDEDGNIVESQVGGYNYIDHGPQNVTQWLENIAHQISGFFTGAVGAINTLVGAISNFSGTLMSLYIWLPPAVQGILTSAIILAITIGVIKVFI